MASGKNHITEYLGEVSDTLDFWKVKDEDDWEVYRFGGWEYANTQAPYTSPLTGLFYGGIFNAP